MDRFADLVNEPQDPSDGNSAATLLESTLERHGLSMIDMITMHDDCWNAVFDVSSEYI